MPVLIVDENGLSNFVDNSGFSGFVDQDGDFLADAGSGILVARSLTDSSPVLDHPNFSINGLLSANALILSSPIIGNGLFTTNIFVVFSNRVIDFGITVLASEANALFLCSAEPTDYTTALSLQLATKTGTIFGAPGAATLGRKVTSNVISDGSCVADGTVTHWAVVDSTNSRLLVRGPVVTPHSILNGQKFTLPSFSLEFDRG